MALFQLLFTPHTEIMESCRNRVDSIGHVTHLNQLKRQHGASSIQVSLGVTVKEMDIEMLGTSMMLNVSNAPHVENILFYLIWHGAAGVFCCRLGMMSRSLREGALVLVCDDFGNRIIMRLS